MSKNKINNRRQNKLLWMNNVGQFVLCFKNPWQLPLWPCNNKLCDMWKKCFTTTFYPLNSGFRKYLHRWFKPDMPETVKYLRVAALFANAHTNLVFRPSSLVDFLLTTMGPLRLFFVHRNTIAAISSKKKHINRHTNAIQSLDHRITVVRLQIQNDPWSRYRNLRTAKKIVVYIYTRKGFLSVLTYRATDSAALRRSNILHKEPLGILCTSRKGFLNIQRRKTSHRVKLRRCERRTANQKEYARVTARVKPGCSLQDVKYKVIFSPFDANPHQKCENLTFWF